MMVILRYMAAMAPYMIFSLLPAALWRQYSSRRLSRRGVKTTPRHEAGVLVLVCIMTGIFSQTVLSEFSFSIKGFLPHIEILRGNGGLNLKLFDVFRLIRIETFQRKKIDFFLINIVGNVALFIPVGFFTCLLWHKPSFWKAGLAGFSFSAVIELCQLPLARGTDVDDLWLNTLGAVLGWLVYLAVRRLCNEQSFKVSGAVSAPSDPERTDEL